MRTIFFALLLGSAHLFALDVVIVNKPESEQDNRNAYSEEILQEALKKTEKKYGNYEFRHADMVMQRASVRSASGPIFQGDNDRLLYEIKRGEFVNVAPLVTRTEWEQETLPIRIPIDRGLMSYRIFLINQQDQAKFSAIQTLAELKALRAGVGETWSTYRVMQRQEFTLVAHNNYEGMFQMLAAKRFDYLSRGVNEAFLEIATRQDKFPDMAVERSIVTFIPLPRYFFVSPAAPRLAQRIEEGLKIMLRDGSFQQIFQKHYGHLIEEANFCQRRVFKIDNPFLSKETPLNKPEYWFNPYQRKAGNKSLCKAQ